MTLHKHRLGCTTRDAANVLADAVQQAKDCQIAAAAAELEQALLEARMSRKQLGHAIRSTGWMPPDDEGFYGEILDALSQ